MVSLHPAGDPRPRAADVGPGPPARGLHVFVLWGFAVVQPLFDLLGRNAQFFVAQDSRPGEIVALVLMLCFLFPVLLMLGELLAGLASPSTGRVVHRILVALLVAATILPLLKRLAGGLPGVPQISVALVFGAAAAWVYQRFGAIRTYLSILAPAPLVFAAMFLLYSPVGKLVRPESPHGGAEATPSKAVSEPAARHPVVLVIFDELSLPTLMDETRRIDALRYPNFAALEGSSHWFRNATATADDTVLALPAILTGRYLAEDSRAQGNREALLATAASYPDNLFTLLGGDYRLNVFESVTQLCPSEMCGSTELDLSTASRMRYLGSDLAAVYLHRLLPVDLVAWLPPVNHQWGHFALFVNKQRKRAAWGKSGRKARYFAAFQDAIRADTAPDDGGSLHFIHSGLPHVPWRFLPSGNSYATKESGLLGRPGLHKGRWVKDRWPVVQGFQRYLLQLGFVDRLLGDLLHTLEEVGWYDRALVIVTADHGVSFRPGGQRRRVDRQNFADIMSVPLFIKLPYQREGILSDRNVELIDVVPTIAEVLGLDVPWPMDGSSVFATTPERAEKRVFHGPNKRRGLTFDAAEMDAMYDTVEHMAEVFGPSSEPLACYRIGPYPDLVGRPLAELAVATKPRGRVRLKSPESHFNVDPASGFIPALVAGVIRSRELEQGSLALAVAVGGSVAATTHALKTETSQATFSAMVPESAFVAGPNRVAVFVISGPPEMPRLVPTLPAKR